MAFQLDLDCTDFTTNGDRRQVTSKFELGGDFDIQADWVMVGTANRHHNYLFMGVRAGTYWLQCRKYHHSTTYLPHTYRFYRNPGVTANANTSVTSGTFKITRVGTTGYMFYKDQTTGGGFTQLQSGGLVGNAAVQFATIFSKADGLTDPSPSPCTARIDNFQVNSADQIYWP